ncbi:hypothetical protein KJ866_04570 [Patescibacteria group bacterium]|nr:hypothetical protein [Patescibacteria group bacterium]MBU2265318.1 hypothetical protein [Patescibacteria group bacterium]
MKIKKWLKGLFLLGFLIFSLNVINDFEESEPVSKNDLFQSAGDNNKSSYYNQFGKELVIVLGKTIAEEQTFREACRSAYLQEEVYQMGETEIVIIALYLLNGSGDKLLIWRVEAGKLKDAKARKALAWEAAYILLRHLPEPKEEILTITPPKETVL